MTKRMQTMGQKQASAEFFNTIGWLQTFEFDPLSVRERLNRSFAEEIPDGRWATHTCHLTEVSQARLQVRCPFAALLSSSWQLGDWLEAESY